jgi:copper chaperone CopZ
MTGAEITKRLILIIDTIIIFYGFSPGNIFAGTENTSQIILQVNNLTCNDCHQTIINGLQQLDKNIMLSSSRNKQSLVINYPDTVKDNEIIRVIQRLGYKAGITSTRQEGDKGAHTRKNGRVTYGYCTSTCSASSNTWKEFYRRYFAKNK